MIVISIRDGVISSVLTNNMDMEDVQVNVINYDDQTHGIEFPTYDPGMVELKLQEAESDNFKTT